MNTRCFPRANSGDPPYVQPQRGLSSLLAGVAFVPMMLLGLPEAAVGADRRMRRAGGRVRPQEAAGGAASVGLREVTSPGGSN